MPPRLAPRPSGVPPNLPIDLGRRRFLLAAGVTGAAALLAGAARVTVDDLLSRAATDPLAAGDRVLVLVTLYGGNDGINTVVPYADPRYEDLRADLAYSAEEVLRLDERTGLNPALTGLRTTWDEGRLAIVRGVGYPRPDRSHFRSMDIWQTASPDAPVRTGWIGRWLDATGDDPLRAVNIGSVLPPLAVGAKATAAALDLRGRTVLTTSLTAALRGLSRTDSADSPTAALVARACAASLIASGTLDPATADDPDDPDDGPSAAAGSAGGQGELARQLDVVAACIAAGVPTKVYTVSLGGFDTHADERGTQEALLRALDAAVTGFLAKVAKTTNGSGVVLAAYSEFGRRVTANASQGTDHGTAGPVLLTGPGVKGGFYGAQPSLTDLDDGDLKAGVDFRQVYAELLHGCLASDPEQVLGASYDELGFLA